MPSRPGAGHAQPLQDHIDRFLAHRQRENVSEHTLRAYAGDLGQFLEYLRFAGAALIEPDKVDLLLLRAWLADLYKRNLSAVTLRRKVAAMRSFLNYLLREGVVAVNAGRLIGTPKIPKKVPKVMTA